MADQINKIDKRFVHFKTRNAFNTAKNAGEILNDSIVFIADEKRIWTHGQWFNPNGFSAIADKDGLGYYADDINSVIQFLSGGGLKTEITKDQNGNIQVTYTHDPAKADLKNVTTTAGKFISGITFDQYGHVASVTTSDVQQNTYTNVVANAAEDTAAEGAAISNGSVRINTVEYDSIKKTSKATSSIKIQGKDDIAVTALADGTIEVGHVLGTGSKKEAAAGAEPTTNSIQALTSASVDAHGHLIALGSMPVPTKKYVDDKLGDLGKALDTSLILRGVIATEAKNGMVKLPTSGASVGDIYKVGERGTYAGQVCEIGDMIICVKTDVDADGKELGTNPEWVVIQANTDIASDQYLGLVKGGFQTSEANRNFEVQIGTDGTMWVNVPFEYTNTSKSVVTNSATGKSSVEATNGNVYINHLETSYGKTKETADTTTTVKSSINIKGSDATTVTADSSGVITVSSHDTKYGLSKEEKAEYKTFSLLQDGTAIATFKFDEWHEGN